MVSLLAKSKFLFLVPALLLFLFFVMTSATKEGAGIIKMTTGQKQNMNNGNAQRANSCRDTCNTKFPIKGSKPQQDCLLKC